MFNNHKNVFKDDIGQMNTFKATLYLKFGTIPNLCKTHAKNYHGRQGLTLL